MNFVKVIAMPCNNTGSTRGQVQREFYLNINLIAGIFENNILLKDSELLHIGGGYFKNIKLAIKVNPEDL